MPQVPSFQTGQTHMQLCHQPVTGKEWKEGVYVFVQVNKENKRNGELLFLEVATGAYSKLRLCERGMQSMEISPFT